MVELGFNFPNYNIKSYRDEENLAENAAACDIFSLGEFLNLLINLYLFYWKKDSEIF